jgi:hypothetical protein
MALPALIAGGLGLGRSALFAGGSRFLKGLALNGIAAAPLLIDAASELNNPSGDATSNLSGAGGALALGVPGVLLGGALGGGLGRSAARRLITARGGNPAVHPGWMRGAAEAGGVLGGALGGMGLGAAGAGVGRAAAGLTTSPFDQQLARDSKAYRAQQDLLREATLANIPVQEAQAASAARQYAEVSRINDIYAGLQAYRNALYGTAMGGGGGGSDSGYSNALAQIALGGLS